jgi:hypothetical protein
MQSRYWMEMSDISTFRPLRPRGNKPRYPMDRVRVGPTADLKVVENRKIPLSLLTIEQWEKPVSLSPHPQLIQPTST